DTQRVHRVRRVQRWLLASSTGRRREVRFERPAQRCPVSGRCVAGEGGNDPGMATYFQITGKCEEVNESTYTIQSTGEIVTKIQLSLVVPGMRERVLCELPATEAPKTDVLDRWELEEVWVVVGAEGMRALAFERTNARAGEKLVGALVVFQGAEVREASADERRALQQARKAQKIAARQRRAARAAKKQVAKETATASSAAAKSA